MKIFNTLTRRKEEFVPLEPGKVKMYVCGPTVYNFIHIGNARPMIIFDTVRRYFEYKGYEVNYVSNFTDVDDKIIKKANEEGVDPSVISERYIAECKKDMAALNVKPATTHPQATKEIISRSCWNISQCHRSAKRNAVQHFADGSISAYSNQNSGFSLVFCQITGQSPGISCLLCHKCFIRYPQVLKLLFQPSPYPLSPSAAGIRGDFQ